MKSLHLTEGSIQPEMVEGKLRLYSMEHCPFAHRVRLVLKAKNVPHDIVNINLMRKPSWLFKLHPEGKVPILDTGSEIITESVDIANYLDEKYPEPPLYPTDAGEKEKDKALIQKMDALIEVYFDILFGLSLQTPAEWLENLAPYLQIFEDELKRREKLFFGGDHFGMIDLMLWPWAERARTVELYLREKLPFTENSFPCLRAWKRALRKEQMVDCMYHGPEKFYTVVMYKNEGITPDYDNI